MKNTEQQPEVKEPETAPEPAPVVEEPAVVTDQIADYQDRVKAAHAAAKEAGAPQRV